MEAIGRVAGHGLSVTCIGMWHSFSWTWHNCGSARCPGAQCGRARHRIVWIMFGGHMMFLGTLSWPVRRHVLSDSLKPCHSGISTDILLFSDINLSLVHHYRIPKGVLPHIAFCWNYMSRMPMRPVRVMGGSVSDLSILTIQDPSDIQGALVYDFPPPLLPVSLQLSYIGPLSGQPTLVSASVAVPPWE